MLDDLSMLTYKYYSFSISTCVGLETTERQVSGQVCGVISRNNRGGKATPKLGSTFWWRSICTESKEKSVFLVCPPLLLASECLYPSILPPISHVAYSASQNTLNTRYTPGCLNKVESSEIFGHVE